MSEEEDALLDEQVAYYRARAPEYDRTSTADGDPFAEATAQVRAGIRAEAPFGRVLELAAGTGQWTSLLAELSDELTITDASPEMLGINPVARRAGTRAEVVDAFRLAPSGDKDVVFFGFFLSHVPLARFDRFWSGLEGVLAGHGRVIFVDEGDHGLWDEAWIDRERGIVQRTLDDGSLHRAVKVLWRPDDLRRRLAQLGWDTSVEAHPPFYWGIATR